MFNPKMASITELRNIQKIVTRVINNPELLKLIKKHSSRYHDDILTKIISLWNYYLYKINMLKNSDFYNDMDFDFYELIFTELYIRDILLT